MNTNDTNLLESHFYAVFTLNDYVEQTARVLTCSLFGGGQGVRRARVVYSNDYEALTEQ